MVCTAVFSTAGSVAVLLAPVAIGFVWLMCVDWKTAYWLLLFSIPFSVDIKLGSFSTSVPDEPVTWLFMLLLALLFAYNPRAFPRRALLNPVAALLVAQVVWTAIATVYSTNPSLSIKYLLVKIWLFAVFFLFPLLVFRERKDFVRGFRAVALPVLLTVVFIMTRHAQVGFQFSRVSDAIGNLYYNHVDYSTVLSMIFPVACLAWPSTESLSRSARACFIAAPALLATAIFLSYARAAILAVAFAFIVVLSIRYRVARAVMPLFYIALVAVSAWLIHENKYLVFRPDYDQTYMHHDLNSHMQATFSGTDMSGMERVYRWIAAVRMSGERPLTGFGPNTFVANYKPYTLSDFRTYVSHNPERSTTHNYFLHTLAEQGWPGMLLYALLIPVVIASAQRTYNRLADPFYRRCTLAAAAMFSAAFVNNFFSELTDTHKVGALFYISMALIVVLEHRSRTQPVEQERGA